MRRIQIRLFVLAQVRLATLDERGQTTAEYVLLILGAATIAILVTSWASGTDKVGRLFDRMLAQTHVVGTAVFAIYVADALGYTGSVGVQLYKDLIAGETTRLDFFRAFTYALSAGSAALILVSAGLILRSTRTQVK